MRKMTGIYKTAIFVTICTVIPMITTNKLLLYLPRLKPEHDQLLFLALGILLAVMILLVGFHFREAVQQNNHSKFRIKIK